MQEKIQEARNQIREVTGKKKKGKLESTALP
jgi:hypothetical protein